MSPVISMKTWGHEHQAHPHLSMTERWSRWLHGGNFWPTIGVIVVLGLMALMIYMTIKFGPLPVNDMTNTYPHYFGIP